MVKDLIKVKDSLFDANPNWNLPLPSLSEEAIKNTNWVEFFDQNGYDMCLMEQLLAQNNNLPTVKHRDYNVIKKPWYIQPQKLSGAVLNHCILFERKGVSGDASEQLLKWAYLNPLLYKVINIRPKWGIDFSMDYVDEKGHAFEVFHYEWDTFKYEQIEGVRKEVENVIETVDWDEAALELLERKTEWMDLEFFEQSLWKTNFFHLKPERFKMVVWNTNDV